MPIVVISYCVIPASASEWLLQLNPPSWGLDRIDQRVPGEDNKYNYKYTGKDVDIYILDSGINTSHVDFTGRIKPGVSYTSDTVEDCHGHGTHVSGIAAGSTYGIAKEANIIPVKVLDCYKFGSIFDVLSGIDWVIAQHDSSKVAVMNLSFASNEFDPQLNAKVRQALADNIVVVAGAGNNTGNASNYSPASEPTILTVAGSTIGNGVALTSNYGSVIDLYAPSSMIVSAWKGSSTAFESKSGTSQAASFVSGIAALAIEQYSNKSAEQIMSLIIDTATTNVLSSVPSDTPNKLAYALLDNTVDSTPVTTTTTSTTTTVAPSTTTTTTVPVTTTTIVQTTTTLPPITTTTTVSETTTTTVPVTTTTIPVTTTTIPATTTTVAETTTTTAVPATTVPLTTTTTTVLQTTTTTTVVPTTTTTTTSTTVAETTTVPITTTTIPQVTTTTSTTAITSATSTTTIAPTTTTTIPVPQSSGGGGGGGGGSSGGSSSSSSGSSSSSIQIPTAAPATTTATVVIIPETTTTTVAPTTTTSTTTVFQVIPQPNKITILCVRNKIIRKITSYNPKCPKGFVIFKNQRLISSQRK